MENILLTIFLLLLLLWLYFLIIIIILFSYTYNYEVLFVCLFDCFAVIYSVSQGGSQNSVPLQVISEVLTPP